MKNLIFVLASLLLAVPSQAGTIFVDANTPDNNDGSSWSRAYKYLQDALAEANSSGDVNQIRVAQGIYTPDTNSADPNGIGDREATFQLINGVAIKGGFAGFGQPDPNARDIELYETILSGDINTSDFSNDNTYCVVTGSDTNETAVLDGFTITAGNANGSEPHNSGGGMYNYESNPTITNCTFSGNSADYRGGGIYNYNSSLTLTNCTFSENSASGMSNYNSSPTLTNCTFNENVTIGMYNYNSSPTLTNCTFSENSTIGMYNYTSSPILTNCTFSASSVDNGGGIFNYYYSSPTVTNCTFSDNSTSGMYNYTSSPTLTNCTFSGNAASYGGGMYNYNSSPTLTNCTFNGNSASYDGGGMLNRYYSSPTVINCILWDNTAPSGSQIYNDGSSSATVTYSDVQSGWSGLGNIDTDPCFVDPGYWADANDPNIVVEPNDPNAVWINGDYHLQSQPGRWDPNAEVWIQDHNTSLCIDAGAPNSDWTAELWPHGKCINMGAYGGTPQASMSPLTIGNITNLDNDPDDNVDFDDLSLFISKWLKEEILIPEDLNRDGVVNFVDYAIFAEHWLEG